MAYEIDYIPVGNGEKSGDAIAIRFGNLTGPRNEQSVIIIDGGFEESGKALVEHVKQYYNTDEINLLISTHPDADHASGLYTVLENMKVGGLLMHKPWDHAADIKNLFKDGRITASGLEERMEKSLQHASDLEALATKKNVPVYEPFQGMNLNNILYVLGPSKEYYESMLPHFRSTPAPKTNLGFLEPLRKVASEVINWIEDNMLIDILNDDEDTTSPENNTSTIILLNIDGHKLLFTGDAGKTALLGAIDYAKTINIPIADINFFDVPHHGSKRNINTKIIKEIKPKVSFVSAAKDSPKHPAKKVTNALQKHGSVVYVNNKGLALGHNHQGVNRGWQSAQPEPFHAKVEE